MMIHAPTRASRRVRMQPMGSCRAFVPLFLGLVLGCGNPQPVVTGVEPAQAYNDDDVHLLLLGHDFLPATTIDPLSGRRIANSDGFHVRMGRAGVWMELAGIDWLSPGVLGMSLPSATSQRLPAGPLDVELTDPRGHTATLAGAFLELGTDNAPPSLVFTSPSPRAPLAPGSVLRGSFHAVDTPPGTIASLAWTVYENGVSRGGSRCLVAPESAQADCEFVFTISQTLKAGNVVLVVADATDRSATGNQVEESLSFTLRDKPSMQSIWPESGGMAGGTDVVIRGSGFLAGSQVTVDGQLLFPDGGIVVDESTISGHVPAHKEGPASLTMHSPLGDSAGVVVFTYLRPPTIASIAPEVGAATGGTAVTITGTHFDANTRIYFGTTLDGAVPLTEQFLQNDTSIVGHVPAGDGQTTVWAFDDTLGFTKLQGGFTWRTP